MFCFFGLLMVMVRGGLVSLLSLLWLVVLVISILLLVVVMWCLMVFGLKVVNSGWYIVFRC